MPSKRRRAPKRARLSLPAGGDRRAFLDAAYAMIAHAWVRLDEAKGRLGVFLEAKSGRGAGLAAAFRAAYAESRARRAAARAERALEAAALSRALELADRVDARRREPEPALAPERLAEIARLLAEDEAARRLKGLDARLTRTWERARREGFS